MEEETVITGSADSNSSTNALRVSSQARNGVFSPGKFKGVVPQPNGNWGAQIYANHQRIWLGTFKSERGAAMAYDSAAIKIRSGDSFRNCPWTDTTLQEPDFQAQYSVEAVLNMIRDGSYQFKFREFLMSHSQSREQKVGLGRGGLLCRQLFQKELTPSDVGKLNRLVIPKKYAVKYFPRVSESAEENADGSVSDDLELVFYDKLMRLWKFRYCYWASSQSFVFTRGWNRFVKENELKANHTITFLLCEHKVSSQKQNFCMIDIDIKGQTKGGASSEGAKLDVGMMHLELRLSPILETNIFKNLEEEEDGVVEVDSLESQLAFRPSVVDAGGGSGNLREDEEMGLHLELELANKLEEVKAEPRNANADSDSDSFKLFGVKIKRQCCREGF